MAPFKAIVFDLLTGLLDSWTIWDLAIPDSEQGIASGTTWRKRYLEITYGCGTYKPYEDLVEQAAKEVGLSAAAPAALIARYNDIRPWSEVPEVLVALKSQGYKLAIVTNISVELGRRTVSNLEKRVQEKTGQTGFIFDTVITAAESGFYKPHPKPYQDALNALGVSASEALFVAGSSSDVPGAAKVGMQVVWNNHIGLERKGDVVPLREGKNLIEALGDVLEQ